tara:strand:- start:1684 stop:2505 length:822 start_codon:yes stop_codon:yes gene_type:complete
MADWSGFTPVNRNPTAQANKPATPSGMNLPVPNVSPPGYSSNIARLSQELSNAQKIYELATLPATKQKALVDLNIAKENYRRLKEKLPEVTEGQGTWGVRTEAMLQGEKEYQQAVSQGYDPVSWGSRITRAVKGIPVLGAGANIFANEVEERGLSAEKTIREGFARGQSQANISESAERPELQRLGEVILPGAWDEPSQQSRKNYYYKRMAIINQSLRAAGLPQHEIIPFEKTSLYKAPAKQSKPMPSEEDIQHTMQVNKMSRDAVLKALGYK